MLNFKFIILNHILYKLHNSYSNKFAATHYSTALLLYLLWTMIQYITHATLKFEYKCILLSFRHVGYRCRRVTMQIFKLLETEILQVARSQLFHFIGEWQRFKPLAFKVWSLLLKWACLATLLYSLIYASKRTSFRNTV